MFLVLGNFAYRATLGRILRRAGPSILVARRWPTRSGGDPWNDAFKAFLRNEWRHIAEVTGQPFGFTLLDSSHFDYDTEPACRAVVAIQMLSGQLSLPKLRISANVISDFG